MARVLLFSLEELRARFGDRVPPGDDPRHHTGPFQAFRAALLEALGPAGPGSLSMWWEGTYNGYALAVAIEPAGAPIDVRALEAVCPPEDDRVRPARGDAVPLARFGPEGAVLLRDAGGALLEAPFGAASGHFGAPGLRRVF